MSDRKHAELTRKLEKARAELHVVYTAYCDDWRRLMREIRRLEWEIEELEEGGPK